MTTIAQAIAAKGEDASYGTIAQAVAGISGTTAKSTIAATIAGANISGGNVEAFVVSFDANTGSGTIADVACADGSTVKLPTSGVTKSGYRLAGWAESASATEADYEPGADFAATETTTLYAFWVQQFTVTYDANTGTGTIDPDVVDAGESVTLPTEGVTKADKALAGWGNASDATEPVESPYTPAASVTLYAIWTDAD